MHERGRTVHVYKVHKKAIQCPHIKQPFLTAIIIMIADIGLSVIVMKTPKFCQYSFISLNCLNKSIAVFPSKKEYLKWHEF